MERRRIRSQMREKGMLLTRRLEGFKGPREAVDKEVKEAEELKRPKRRQNLLERAK
jgi:hypothetical protein